MNTTVLYIYFIQSVRTIRTRMVTAASIRLFSGCLAGWLFVCETFELIDGWMDGWTDGWMDVELE